MGSPTRQWRRGRPSHWSMPARRGSARLNRPFRSQRAAARYARVYRLKRRLPGREVVLNARRRRGSRLLSPHKLDGVMMGRAAYQGGCGSSMSTRCCSERRPGHLRSAWRPRP